MYLLTELWNQQGHKWFMHTSLSLRYIRHTPTDLFGVYKTHHLGVNMFTALWLMTNSAGNSTLLQDLKWHFYQHSVGRAHDNDHLFGNAAIRPDGFKRKNNRNMQTAGEHKKLRREKSKSKRVTRQMKIFQLLLFLQLLDGMALSFSSEKSFSIV